MHFMYAMPTLPQLYKDEEVESVVGWEWMGSFVYKHRKIIIS